MRGEPPVVSTTLSKVREGLSLKSTSKRPSGRGATLHELMAQTHRHPGFGCGACQAVDYGLGALRSWEHTLVVLCRQLNSVLFKPLTGVVVVERVEKPFHQFVAPWIDALQVVDAEERVGEVASASARHANLGQHTAALLEDGHRVGRMAFL